MLEFLFSNPDSIGVKSTKNLKHFKRSILRTSATDFSKTTAKKTPQRIQFGRDEVKTYTISNSNSSSPEIISASNLATAGSNPPSAVMTQKTPDSTQKSAYPNSQKSIEPTQPSTISTQNSADSTQKSSSSIYMTESQAPLNTGPRYDPVIPSTESDQPDAMSSIDLDNSIFTMDKQSIQSRTEKSLKRKRSEPEISNNEENVQPALKVMITEEFFKHFEEFKTHTTTMYKQLSTDYVKLIQDERKKFEEERQAMKEERRIYQARFNDH